MKKSFVYMLVLAIFLTCMTPLTALAGELTSTGKTLTIMRSEHASFTYSMEQPVIEELEKRLGIDIELMIFPSGDYSTKRNLLLATNDMPDIMCSTYNVLAQYVPEDMFVNLSDYWDRLPNYAASIARYPELANAFKVDGDFYWFIMMAENAPAYGNFPIVREDVLEKIGWDAMPDNYDELYDMLKAIKAYDPESIPMTTRGTDVLWRMGYPFGTYNGVYYEKNVDGYQYGPLYDNYKDFLGYLGRLYAEGLLDPDYTTSNKTIWQEYLTSGKSYFYFDNGSFASDFNIVLTDEDPTMKLGPMYTLENYYGERRSQFFEGSGYISPFRNDVWVVNSESENLEGALMLMDYLYSEEGAMLCSFGIEGEHYFVGDDGEITFDMDLIDYYRNNANDPYREYSNYIGIGCLALSGRFYDDAWYEFMDEDTKAMYDFWLADENIGPYSYTLTLNAQELEHITDIKTACDTLVSTESNKFIMGIRPLDEYDAFVEELRALGAEEIEAVYNAAYQRSLQ